MRDRDRVLLRVDNWEDLLTMGDPLAERPAFATAENPLNMYLTVKALRKALKDSLSSISQNRDKLDKTPELTAETDALVVQRKAALDWLKQQTAERVYIALYPETEWQIGPVAGADDAEDGDDER
jgi:hypothetical protein